MKKEYTDLIENGLKKVTLEIESMKKVITVEIDVKLTFMKEWIDQMN